jgi:hypothetical protein
MHWLETLQLFGRMVRLPGSQQPDGSTLLRFLLYINFNLFGAQLRHLWRQPLPGIMTRFGVVMFVSFVAQCAAALVLSAVVLVVSVAVIWLSSFDLATTVALLNLKRHVDCL